MKRAIGILIAAMTTMLVTPLLALAQGSGLEEPSGEGVAGSGGSLPGGAGGTAFTGGEVVGLVVLAVALAVIGTTLILKVRRRSIVPAKG
jgi:hypothetical protein